MTTNVAPAPFISRIGSVSASASLLDFELPPELEAHEPPTARDDVRLLVSRGSDEPIHARFDDLPRFLKPGDLLVINTSATVPAALTARRPDGEELQLHISTQLEDGHWLVEPRDPAPPASLPYTGDLDREVLALPDGATATLLQHFADSSRLWVAHLDIPEPMPSYLTRHGFPIRYRYVNEPWPISEYQNVYATDPGSAEMPSAGRPFTTELLTRLLAAGVDVAPVLLHTGVSSLESHERPYPEYYRVSESTARRVNQAERVIAIGTTVVRALETVTDADGVTIADEGWTDLVIEPSRRVRAVDGLLTGWHEPLASHLLMLEAIAGHDALAMAYAAAIAHGYHWHEFGDSHLIMP
ncbi:MAG TPA: S-adenosylmethionine:tRNA ribosyltransferase-isomerase [Acidimicrobiales bacterium]|nr:S-adenosylmethionine:tRNA ribosyltransferase-isomerase [Acidimicrobiales bacterium]